LIHPATLRDVYPATLRLLQEESRKASIMNSAREAYLHDGEAMSVQQLLALLG
jgi:hypothetical protein